MYLTAIGRQEARRRAVDLRLAALAAQGEGKAIERAAKALEDER